VTIHRLQYTHPRTLFAFAGIPGSGKTSLVSHLITRYPEAGFVVINPDSIRQEMTGSAADQSRNPEVWGKAYERLARATAIGQPVIFDATLADLRTRDQILRNTPSDYRRVLALMDTPLQVALIRNANRPRQVPEQVLRRMDRKLREEPPSLGEGWSEIIRVG
jgi:predicted kinase